MASGLILLAIVGAWLGVLVPMALRSHDSAASLGSVDRFHDAMTVLSGNPRRRRVAPPVGLTMAERRRRTLLCLVGMALVTLGGGLYGAGPLLGVHVVCDLLIVGFVVHCRRQAVLKARRPARRTPVAVRRRPAPRVAGIPDRMPRRPAPLTITLPAPAARYEDAIAVDMSWSPVPVPPPVYVGKPVAPARPPRVLDLTKPGEWTATLEDGAAADLDEGPELEEILERRRVSGGW